MHEESEQLDLNFGAPVSDGYANWLWEREEAVQRISEVWGIPLGQNVRFCLSGIDGEFQGVLRLAEMPRKLDRRLPLKLKMGRHVFDSSEVENCTVIASP